MKRFTAALLLLGLCATSLSSCSFFRKIIPPKTTTTPTTPIEKAPPEEKKPVEETPVEAAAPFHVPAFGQKAMKPVYDIALFTPLSIEQIVSDTGFSVNSNTPLPPATLSGLEFYEGALLAMDTLQKQGIPLRLFVYDTKSTSRPVSRALKLPEMDSADLILGSVNATELEQIGKFAKEKQINFISATYPNDAGVRNNPFLTIVNSTLRVHCKAIQDFAQQKFSNQQITVVYGDNSQEKHNVQYLKDAHAQMKFSRKVPLQEFEWTQKSTVENLKPRLSKEKTNILIITALYPEVALSIIGQLATISDSFQIQVIGMPTLDGQTALKKPEYKGINIYYSSPYPYLNATNTPVMKNFLWKFFTIYRSRPSDMAIKGYETLYYFAHLLQKDGMYFNAKINDASARLLSAFNFQPVYNAHSEDRPPDYFENEHLYFMQMRDGHVTHAN